MKSREDRFATRNRSQRLFSHTQSAADVCARGDAATEQENGTRDETGEPSRRPRLSVQGVQGLGGWEAPVPPARPRAAGRHRSRLPGWAAPRGVPDTPRRGDRHPGRGGQRAQRLAERRKHLPEDACRTGVRAAALPEVIHGGVVPESGALGTAQTPSPVAHTRPRPRDGRLHSGERGKAQFRVPEVTFGGDGNVKTARPRGIHRQAAFGIREVGFRQRSTPLSATGFRGLCISFV